MVQTVQNTMRQLQVIVKSQAARHVFRTVMLVDSQLEFDELVNVPGSAEAE